jgi:hypothetical protein
MNKERGQNTEILNVKAGGVYRYHFKFERLNKASRPQDTGVALSTQLLRITVLDMAYRSDPARGPMFKQQWNWAAAQTALCNQLSAGNRISI